MVVGGVVNPQSLLCLLGVGAKAPQIDSYKKTDLVWQEGSRKVLINVFLDQRCRLALGHQFWGESLRSISTCMT